MPRIHQFTVIAELPASLLPLRTLASNLWWSWNHSAQELFARISTERFLESGGNPIALINSLSRSEIQALEDNREFLRDLAVVLKEFEDYRSRTSWWDSQDNSLGLKHIAYFSAEFGLHESLPIYSGGLGVLAGDYLKAASDLGLPVVGVGLLYHEGYFRQYLNADGWQQETYPRLEYVKVPVSPLLFHNGEQACVSIDIGGEIVKVRAWQVEVGRTHLVLLDTNFEDNSPVARAITARLYGGDIHTRIRQEIVLGIGGLRMLHALNIHPTVCHLNEGHSAFLALEGARLLMEGRGLDFSQALVAIERGSLFTTHTPVPAGHDAFSNELMGQYFSTFAQQLGIRLEDLLRLGRLVPGDTHELFSMTIFALRTSHAANGVSKLHGHLSRKLWHGLWPELGVDEIPIRHVTNGIHTSTWASRGMAELFDKYLGKPWREDAGNPASFRMVSQIPDEELWGVLSRNRHSLINFCRNRLKGQLRRRGSSRLDLESAEQVLDPNALTIGFARRFASYKRAALLLRNIDRLVEIVSNPNQPVQFVFSGKAHPADHAGKEIIAHIIHIARRPELRRRFIFIEDYDMGIASHIISGVDVWLNNPRRPLEASGTSGMKAAVNGVLNLSVLDGWWCEGFDGLNGWAIGEGEEYDDPDYQDEVESRAIYDLLIHRIVPLFYDRSSDNIPHAWLAQVKRSIQTLAPQFSSARMVLDYANLCYRPLAELRSSDEIAGFETVRVVAEARAKLQRHWSEVRINNVHTFGDGQIALGANFKIRVATSLGSMSSNEVACEVVFGPVDSSLGISSGQCIRLNSTEEAEGGQHFFEGEICSERAGTYGFSVRLVPLINGTPDHTVPGCICWWS